MADSSISGHRSSRLAPGRPGYLHRQEAVGQPSLWYSAGTAVLHMHGISSVAISITNNTLLVCISATWWKTDLEARHPSYSAYLPIRTHEHVQYLPVELHLRRWQTSSRCRSRRELAGRDLTRSPPRGRPYPSPKVQSGATNSIVSGYGLAVNGARCWAWGARPRKAHRWHRDVIAAG